MNYLKHLFGARVTELPNEANVISPVETAICPTPNESRRIIKTIEGLELILSADDVKHLKVIYEMFENLKSGHDDNTAPTILIPISINSATLQNVLKWTRARKKGRVTLNELFPTLTTQECLQMLEASFFLDLKSLSEASAKWIAAKLEGQPSRKMAEILGRLDNFGVSPEKREILTKYRDVVLTDTQTPVVQYSPQPTGSASLPLLAML